jgi:hypothetical protein
MWFILTKELETSHLVVVLIISIEVIQSDFPKTEAFQQVVTGYIYRGNK